MRRLPGLGLPILVAATGIGAMWPVMANGFVSGWDDGANFLTNPRFLGLGGPQLRWAWSTRKLGVYQPIGWMILEAESAVFGLDPTGYHLVSVAFHAINAVLLYFLINSLLNRLNPRPSTISATLAAAAWAAHPLRVEAVAWASCQPYLPCSGFSMGSTLAYLRSVDRPVWRVASLVLFAAACLSKAAAVAFPVVLIILDVYPLRRGVSRRILAEKSPFFAVALIFALVAVWARAEPPEDPTLILNARTPGAVERVAKAAYGLNFYLWKTAIPLGLTAFHVSPEPFDPLEPRFALALLAASLGIVSAIVLAPRWPAVSAAFASYLAIVSPCLGLVPFGDQLTADRYAYAATIPVFVLLAGCLSRPAARRWRLGRRGGCRRAHPLIPIPVPDVAGYGDAEGACDGSRGVGSIRRPSPPQGRRDGRERGVGGEAGGGGAAGVADRGGVAAAEGGADRGEAQAGRFAGEMDGQMARDDEPSMAAARPQIAGRDAESGGDLADDPIESRPRGSRPLRGAIRPSDRRPAVVRRAELPGPSRARWPSRARKPSPESARASTAALGRRESSSLRRAIEDESPPQSPDPAGRAGPRGRRGAGSTSRVRQARPLPGGRPRRHGDGGAGLVEGVERVGQLGEGQRCAFEGEEVIEREEVEPPESVPQIQPAADRPAASAQRFANASAVRRATADPGNRAKSLGDQAFEEPGRPRSRSARGSPAARSLRPSPGATAAACARAFSGPTRKPSHGGCGRPDRRAVRAIQRRSSTIAGQGLGPTGSRTTGAGSGPDRLGVLLRLSLAGAGCRPSAGGPRPGARPCPGSPRRAARRRSPCGADTRPAASGSSGPGSVRRGRRHGPTEASEDRNAIGRDGGSRASGPPLESSERTQRG